MNQRMKKITIMMTCMLLAIILLPSINAYAKTTKLSKCTVTVSDKKYVYTGNNIQAKVSVKYNQKKLKKNKDYKLTYKNNVNAGTATVIVQGIGKYSGSKKVKFSIQKRDIGDASLKIVEKTISYTGKALKPAIEVKYKNKVLKKDKDYKVNYSNNIEPGSGTVTITGIKNFCGTASKNFNIAGKNGNNPSDEAIVISKNSDSYAVATNGNVNGKLSAEQRADNILSGFKTELGSKYLNHPNGIASDGSHFVICDTWNNRVLIYNSLPTGNRTPDVVIGQQDLTSYEAGYEMNQLNWPVSACFAGGKLYIADTHNDRVLVYNSTPTTNGAAADSVISTFGTEPIRWPWAVWSDGTKLIVTGTKNGKIGIWNSAASAAEGQASDILMDVKGTPRTVISDGNYLLIGDHNLNGAGQSGCYIWKTFPKTNSASPDFTINTQYGGGFIAGNLYGLSNDGNFYVYDGAIDSANEAYKSTFGNIQGYMQAGDYNQIVYVGGKTYASFYNSSVVAIYQGKLTASNYNNPIGYIGADKATKSTTVDNGLYQNPIPATDGTSLVLADDFNRLLLVYKKIPNTNNVKADVVYSFGSHANYPIDVKIDSSGKLYVLTADAMLVWNKVPLNGENYDTRICFDHNIGKDNSHFAVDDSYIYLYSGQDRKLYKLKKNASSYNLAASVKSVTNQYIRNLSTDGKYVFAAAMNDSKIVVYQSSDLSVYGEIKKDGFGNHLNLPTDAIHLPNGQMLVSDASRVAIWDSLEDAISDKSFSKCSNLGVLDNYMLETEEAELATSGSLFTPTNMTYANGHLWVGEFKFSSRLVRFDLK